MKEKVIKRKKIFMLMLLMLMFISCISEVRADAKGFDSNIFYGEETGVDEVDDAMDRGDKIGKGAIKFIGKWVTIIAFIFFVISLPTHQQEMRYISLIGLIVGVGVYFGPEIVDKILKG